MAFTAAIFVVRYIPVVFNTTIDCFREAKFEDGRTCCFIRTGCVPITEGGKEFEIFTESKGTRRQAPLSLQMLSAEDVETFIINDEVTEEVYIIDGINAYWDGCEEEGEVEDFKDDY